MWEKQITVVINNTASSTANRTLTFVVPEILESAALILVDTAITHGTTTNTQTSGSSDQILEWRLGEEALKSPHTTDLSASPSSHIVLGWTTVTKSAQAISAPGPIFTPAPTIAAEGLNQNVWTISATTLGTPTYELLLSATVVVLRIRGMRSLVSRPPTRSALGPIMRYQFRPEDALVQTLVHKTAVSFKIYDKPAFEGPLRVTFDLAGTFAAAQTGANIMPLMYVYGLSVPDATLVGLSGYLPPKDSTAFGIPTGTPLIIGLPYLVRGSAPNSGNASSNGRRSYLGMGGSVITGRNPWPRKNSWKVNSMGDIISFYIADLAGDDVSGRASHVLAKFCCTMTVQPYFPEEDADVFDEM